MTKLSPRYVALRAERGLRTVIGMTMAALLTLVVVMTWLVSMSLGSSRR